MTATQERLKEAQAALWDIPSYASVEVPTIGVDLERVIASIRNAVRKISSEARVRPGEEDFLRALGYTREAGIQPDEDDEGLDSYKTFGYISRQIEQLLEEPVEDEFGKVRPTPSAASWAKSSLFQVAEGRVLPEPEDVSTDRDGAIRISWRKDDRFLELVFPYETDVRPYLYHSEGAMFDIDEDLSARHLRGWVRWIEGGARPK
jgi:hypothetical protein